VPAKTPSEIIEKLHDGTAKALTHPLCRESCQRSASIPPCWCRRENSMRLLKTKSQQIQTWSKRPA
jgi:hypothetical protein